jgi:phosphatidylglycerophosphate synthase
MQSVPTDATRRPAPHAQRPPLPQRPLHFGALVAAGLIIVGFIAGGLGERPGILGAMAGFVLVAALAGRALWHAYPHDRLGLCNIVTMVRAMLACALIAPVMRSGSLAADDARAWAVLCVAAFALALDAVDGWLARRSGLASAFGARFDMEVDAVLALILSILALQADKAGLWVLALGGMRYAYLAAGMMLPVLRGTLPESFRRKLICVIQIAALIALLAPVVQPPLSQGIAGLACLLLALSFAIDIAWLVRRK